MLIFTMCCKNFITTWNSSAYGESHGSRMHEEVGHIGFQKIAKFDIYFACGCPAVLFLSEITVSK